MKRIQRGFKSSCITLKLTNQDKPRISLKERMAAVNQQNNAPVNSSFNVPKFYVKPKDLPAVDSTNTPLGNNAKKPEFQALSIVDQNAASTNTQKMDSSKFRLPNIKTNFRPAGKSEKKPGSEADSRSKRPLKPKHKPGINSTVKPIDKTDDINELEDDLDSGTVAEDTPITIVEAVDDDLDTKKVHKKDLQRDKEKRLRELERKAAAKAKAKTAKVKAKNINIPNFITVANLGNLLGVNYSHLSKKMKELGFDDYPPDYVLNSELISMIALEYNFNPIIMKQEVVTAEPRPEPEDWSTYPTRPPVITIMGHVDHGKTTLLDSLRKTSVAAGEAGGITQHIGAFSVLLPSQKRITFLDTPGHAAFSQMRARGAQVTDIVVLIVAADDGVMPQTIEAIDHAQKANVPIIVAINKCDKPGVNPKKIKEDLLRYNITVEDYGGEIPAVEISGKTGKGLAELEETILAIAEVNDYRGDPTGPVEATVVESKMTKGFGNVATVIVKRGTLVPGAIIVAGESLCKVRKMIDEHGKTVKSIGPSGPIEVLGWKELPSAGELVLQVESEFIGKKVIESRKRLAEFNSSVESVEAMNEKAINKLEDTEAVEEAPKKNEYRVIIKADVDGSTEAIANVLAGIPSHEVSCNIINSSVGALSEADVNYAIASKADIITFNIPVQKSMLTLANQNKINIHSHNVIYTLIDQVKASMSELLPPEIVTNVTGEASIAQLFSITVKGKQESIAGCKVFNGKITKNSILRVVRDGAVIHEGKIKTFKHHKKDILEAAKGLECGIAVEGFPAIQEGDILQSINITHKKRTIE